MFRFTIRDVLWLTVLAAVTVAWSLDRRSNRQAQDKLHERVLALDQQVLDLEADAVARRVLQAELQIELKKAEVENVRLQLERDSSSIRANNAE